MIFLRKPACLIRLFRLMAGLALLLGVAQFVQPAAADQTDSEFYSALAEQARETAARAQRTAAGEQENARRARENAENWRGIAVQAREMGQGDNARSAEEKAARAESAAREADAAAKRAERRAQIAEREAQAFDERASQAGAIEAREAHAAVLVDPDTVFHRLYIIGSLEEGVLRDTMTTDLSNLQQCLEGADAQADDSTTTTLVTPRREELRQTLEQMQERAAPGNEVTLSYAGHGGGGPFWGGRDVDDEDDEEFDEHLNINDHQSVRDDKLAEWLSGFDPGVSITLVLNSCFGGGFTGGGTDVQESNSVNVIGVGNTCPGTGRTLLKDVTRGCEGEADYDEDGILTAEELESFLRADGWDIRAPYDDSSDISAREQIEIWGDDLENWMRGSLVQQVAQPAPLVFGLPPTFSPRATTESGQSCGNPVNFFPDDLEIENTLDCTAELFADSELSVDDLLEVDGSIWPNPLCGKSWTYVPAGALLLGNIAPGASVTIRILDTVSIDCDGCASGWGTLRLACAK